MATRSPTTPTAALAANASASQKPAWARNAVEADDAVDDEVADLLDFTKNLDFDEYIDDMEVRDALQFVKARVDDAEAKAKEDAAVAAYLADRAARLQRGESVGDLFQVGVVTLTCNHARLCQSLLAFAFGCHARRWQSIITRLAFPFQTRRHTRLCQSLLAFAIKHSLTLLSTSSLLICSRRSITHSSVYFVSPYLFQAQQQRKLNADGDDVVVGEGDDDDISWTDSAGVTHTGNSCNCSNVMLFRVDFVFVFVLLRTVAM
jgi:hypothetical protein